MAAWCPHFAIGWVIWSCEWLFGGCFVLLAGGFSRLSGCWETGLIQRLDVFGVWMGFNRWFCSGRWMFLARGGSVGGDLHPVTGIFGVWMAVWRVFCSGHWVILACERGMSGWIAPAGGDFGAEILTRSLWSGGFGRVGIADGDYGRESYGLTECMAVKRRLSARFTMRSSMAMQWVGGEVCCEK